MPPRARPAAPAHFPVVALGAAVLVTLLAFSPALTAPLLFDDTTSVDHNATITQLWPPSVALRPPAESPTAGRPVANYSLAINYALNHALGIDQSRDPGGPEKTISYHILNLIIHLASGLLLFGIVRRTLRSPRFAERRQDRADALALFVAAIWLLHPLQTEAVDYITQRTEVLVSLCYLATLYCSIRAWDGAATIRMRWHAAAIASCLLGMGSKEVMVSAPLMVVLYDRAFRLNNWRDIATSAMRERRWFYAALWATLLLLAALVSATPRTSAGLHTGMPWFTYLNSQGWAVPHYLRLALWPSGLTIDYGQRPLALWRGLPGLLLLGTLGVATVVAWTRANRWGWLGFCGAWFFCLMAPSSSVVPVATEIAAERRIYLALGAVIVVVVIGVDAWLQRMASDEKRMASTRTIVAGALVVIAMLAVLTFRRSTMYQHPDALWSGAIAKVPDNPRAWNNLGQLLADAPVPRNVEAGSLFRQAVHLDSSYVPALYNLATSDIAERRLDDAEQLLRRVTAIEPDDESALAHLGEVLALRGDLDGALSHLERAVALAPDDAGALTTLDLVKKAIGKRADMGAPSRP
jgi:tetratricopeptide (TPR) repeat protein